MLACQQHFHPLRYRKASLHTNVLIGGRGGIRTHGTVAGTLVFKTSSLNRSDTLPGLACGLTEVIIAV